MKTIIKTEQKAQLKEQAAASVATFPCADLSGEDLGGSTAVDYRGNSHLYPHFHSCEDSSPEADFTSKDQREKETG